jgi:hypothetical protein
MWYRPSKSSPVHDRSYRDWNQRTVIVESAFQRSLGRSNNLAVEFFKRLNAFSPLPFNAAMDAQGIYGTHYVNLADALQRYFVARLLHHLSTGFDFTSPAGSTKPLTSEPSIVCFWLFLVLEQGAKRQQNLSLLVLPAGRRVRKHWSQKVLRRLV